MAPSSTQMRGLVSGLAELYEPVGSTDFPDRVITVVSGLLRVGSCSYNHLDGSRALAFEIQPADVLEFPDAYSLFELHLPAHPVLSYVEATGDGSACRVSDIVSDRKFRALGLYRDFYRHAEVDHQLCFLAPHRRGSEIGLVLNRKGPRFLSRRAGSPRVAQVARRTGGRDCGPAERARAQPRRSR